MSSDAWRRLSERRFRSLTPHETATHGWVDAGNLLRTELTPETVLRGDHAVFALRIDRRRADPRLLRARLELEMEARWKAAADAQAPGGARRRRIGRDERRQLRADIEAELLATANPSIRVCTVLLQPRQKIVHALSRSRPVLEILSRLFVETFDVNLVPLTPWGRAREILAGQPAAEVLDGLEPTGFAAAEGDETLSRVRAVEVSR